MKGKMWRKNLVFLTVVLVLLSAVFLGCSQQQQQPAEKTPTATPTAVEKAPEYIKIGYTLSLTGKHADAGKYYADAYKLAEKEINEKGGIYVKKYGKKIPVKLIGYDDESKAEKAVGLYEKMKTVDGVIAFLGPYSSTITYSVVPIAEKYHTPIVEGGGASNKLFTQGWKTIFAVLPTTEHYADAALEYFASLPPEKKPKLIAVLQEDTIVGETAAKGITEYAKKLGLNVKVFGPYPADVKDMTPIIQQVENSGADVIMDGGHFYGDTLMIKTIREKGLYFKAEWVYVAIGMDDFYKALGKDANYVMGYSCFSTKLPGAKEFVEKYKKLAGRDPDYHAALGYAAAQVLFQAIERAGSLDSKDILNALRMGEFNTILGPMSFKENGMPKKMPVLLLQIQAPSGKTPSPEDLQIIWPKEFRTADPVYPKPK